MDPVYLRKTCAVKLWRAEEKQGKKSRGLLKKERVGQEVRD